MSRRCLAFGWCWRRALNNALRSKGPPQDQEVVNIFFQCVLCFWCHCSSSLSKYCRRHREDKPYLDSEVSRSDHVLQQLLTFRQKWNIVCVVWPLLFAVCSGGPQSQRAAGGGSSTSINLRLRLLRLLLVLFLFLLPLLLFFLLLLLPLHA